MVKNKPKIAIVVCALPPQGGGIGNNAYYQAKQLAKLGYAVTIFTPDYPGVNKIANPDFEIEYLPVTLTIGKAGWLLDLRYKLKPFNLVHVYHPFFGTDLVVKRFKRKHPETKVVLHYQMDPIGRGLTKLIFYLYFKLFLGGIIRRVDKVGVLSFDHAQNSYLKTYLAKYPDKFVELPNAIDTKIFKLGSKDPVLQTSLGLREQDKVLIFVGGLDRQHYFKGLEVLLRAVVQMEKSQQHLKLLVVGDGDLRAKYEKQVKQLGIAERVIFLGWINNNELPDYYRLADVFILPSTASTESFGIVVAEAQACGLPVVVSDWPGVRTTLVPERTGYLVKPKDDQELTNKVIKILSRPQLQADLARAAAVYAQKYSWDIVIKKLLEIYAGLEKEKR